MVANIVKEFIKAPWSAQLGFFIIAINIFGLAFAPVLAPFAETEVIGAVWEAGFWSDDCSPEAVEEIGPCWSQLN